MARRAPIAVLIALWLATPAASGPPRVAEIASPAGPGAGEPFLASDGRSIHMTWLEPAGDGHALRLARWDGAAWSEPRTVAAGDRFFVNWADFPSVLPLADGTLVVHWLARTADEPYAYDVMLSSSRDGGATWSTPFRPHDDGTPTEHGFVTLLPDGRDRFAAVWLDGRAYHGEGATGEMAVRFARFDGELVTGATVLDRRACDCCQTDAVRTASGIVVAYRDRSGDEVRDVSVVRFDGERWSEPRPLHDDGWKIAACPVNGPAVDARGDRVAVAWFTAPPAAGGSPAGPSRGRVLVAFSDDGGATFGAPSRIDGGRPSGRVDLLLLDSGSALVSWVEQSGDGAGLRLRIAGPGGTAGEVIEAAPVAGGRRSGFPRMARIGEAVLLAWTDAQGEGRVRVGRMSLAEAEDR